MTISDNIKTGDIENASYTLFGTENHEHAKLCLAFFKDMPSTRHYGITYHLGTVANAGVRGKTMYVVGAEAESITKRELLTLLLTMLVDFLMSDLLTSCKQQK